MVKFSRIKRGQELVNQKRSEIVSVIQQLNGISRTFGHDPRAEPKEEHVVYDGRKICTTLHITTAGQICIRGNYAAHICYFLPKGFEFGEGGRSSIVGGRRPIDELPPRTVLLIHSHLDKVIDKAAEMIGRDAVSMLEDLDLAGSGFWRRVWNNIVG